jgi:cob(I)alamin adenosyltransferase
MIQIYTGNGKGKTTASTGLIIRALGSGLSSIIIRFIKKGESSEDSILRNLGIPVEYYGTGFIYDEIPPEAKRVAQKAIKRVKQIIENREYDILILDEINCAVNRGLVSEEEIIEILNLITDDMEIVLTGRGATQKMIEKAHLVTDMKEIKHYYKDGIKARKGIEF